MMQGLVRRLVILGVVAMGALAGAGRLCAQAIKGEIVSVGLGAMGGGKGLYRTGSWVPVQVRLENRSGMPFEGHLGVEQLDLDGDKVVSIGPEFVLQPGVEAGPGGGKARTFWTYYWPRPDDLELRGIAGVAVLDKSGQTVIARISTPTGQAEATGIPKKDEQQERSSRFVVVLGKSWAGWNKLVQAWGGTEAVQAIWLQSASDLPDDVKGLDGVDVIVWEADSVKASDFRPEFELKALLAWVRAGGHLIISTGTQWQELEKGGKDLADAMPMHITGVRELDMISLREFPGWGSEFLRNGNKPPTDKKFLQVVGDLKVTSRPVVGQAKGSTVSKLDNERESVPGTYIDHPLVVTGLYGQGAVTLVTFDVTAQEMTDRLAPGNWMKFWNQAAGWQQQVNMYSADEFNRLKLTQDTEKVSTSPEHIQIGQNIPATIDVTDVTFVRIMVAVLFLAAYWLLAGPLGHLVLRFYKLVHWSWWVFGGTVVAATGIAGAVVLVLHVTSYDVRHRSFVMGTVNSDDVTVASFYGVYAPVSGEVELKQPAGAGESAGFNYLVPLCIPTTDEVKPYADPQSYDIWDDHPAAVWPVFRNTLKKMQSRWSGKMPGVNGQAAYGPDITHPLKGTLTNNSGYDLDGVDVIVCLRTFSGLDSRGVNYLYHAGNWKRGQALDLEKGLALDLLGAAPPPKVPTAVFPPLTLEMALQVFGWKKSDSGPMSHRYSRNSVEGGAGDEQKAFAVTDWPRDDLLYVLLDARKLDDLQYDDRREAVRGVGRLTDCTKELYAAGALIVAHAGEIGQQRFVKSPVPLTVNGRTVEGKGEVVFTWALPVQGTPPDREQMTVRLGAGGVPVPAVPRGAAATSGQSTPIQPEVP